MLRSQNAFAPVSQSKALSLQRAPATAVRQQMSTRVAATPKMEVWSEKNIRFTILAAVGLPIVGIVTPPDNTFFAATLPSVHPPLTKRSPFFCPPPLSLKLLGLPSPPFSSTSSSTCSPPRRRRTSKGLPGVPCTALPGSVLKSKPFLGLVYQAPAKRPPRYFKRPFGYKRTWIMPANWSSLEGVKAAQVPPARSRASPASASSASLRDV